MSLREQHRAVRQGYGGQAVIEGVMIRGPRHATVVCRRPDGTVASRARALRSSYTGRARKTPLLRGVIILWETLHLGMWALLFSQNVALAEEPADEDKGMGVLNVITMLIAFSIAIGIFFLAPIVGTRWLVARIDPDIIAIVLEGVLRLALLLGYLALIGRMGEIKRVFEYHGAEHMTIAAWESEQALTVENVRRYSRAHPRCGTSFLLVVAVVAILVFTALGHAAAVVAPHQPHRVHSGHRGDRLRGHPLRRQPPAHPARQLAVRAQPLAAGADDARAPGRPDRGRDHGDGNGPGA